MRWISFKDKLPENNDRVVVYKDVSVGGYYIGIHLGFYHQNLDKNYYIVIDSDSTNKGNYRPLREFSHWMPLPEIPKETNE